MPVKPITPGLTPSLSKYLEQRTQEYRDLSAARSTGRNSYDYPPANWPADRCLLTRLPRELLFLVFDCLYQADLYHLAVTCRYLAALALDLLYSRDISDFDCLALRWACTFDIAPTLERTLSYGAPVDHAFRERSHLGCRWVIDMTAVGATCSTPLTTAIGANGSETIRLLVARGANVNTPDPRTSHVGCGGVHEVLFPIHLAMGTPDGPPSGRFQPGNPTIVRQLLDAGADPNQESVCHYPADPAEMVRHVTPLILAMQPQVPVETVRLLLERGAHPTLPGVYRTSSSFTGIEQLPSEFRARAPLDFMLPPDRFRGHLVFPLDLDKIRILLAYGDVNELCYVQPRLSAWLPDELDDRVPVLYNHWDHRQAADILNLFIAAGVNIADWAEKAHSPILSVIWWAEDEIRLPRRDGALEQRHSIMSRAVEMITLLAEATLVEPSAAGRSLRNSSIIDAVARLDRPETNLWRTGQTPLRYLCSPLRSVDLTELVPLLLRYGADINGADAGPPTDHGLADINSDDAGRRTALHLAVMFGCGAAAHSLLGFLGGPTSSGLTVDARDGHDWTPLHHACLFGFWRDRARQCAAARLLLDHGADVHARTHRGWTPLAFAVLAANPETPTGRPRCGTWPSRWRASRRTSPRCLWIDWALRRLNRRRSRISRAWCPGSWSGKSTLRCRNISPSCSARTSGTSAGPTGPLTGTSRSCSRRWVSLDSATSRRTNLWRSKAFVVWGGRSALARQCDALSFVRSCLGLLCGGSERAKRLFSSLHICARRRAPTRWKDGGRIGVASSDGKCVQLEQD
ncbi:uncharacterized protein THITE_2109521 [Thermothielavioides terrestris NRRL 8126]|uniref:F-box domain-containing protein n=1 Tax=Thermothielavioides terrestris (strain ATCC 38088 / NRRL 8126) TaxID=578455 RepID=G2QWC3_THETT|nr:uncharacterized protein THITE_2109521 [Thermothielavioides terrestris NRRL 8126]AEO63898.1 hypothetical protein THITE_2109521 [Thermothielavioides terrestris NRRL 8126]